MVADAAASGASTRNPRLANLRPQPPFPQGTSGNPNGRPKGQKGFAAMIRRRTHQGRDLLDFVFGLMQDTEADPRVRLDAATWLANRAFGPIGPEPPPVAPAGDTVTIREIVIERHAGDGDP